MPSVTWKLPLLGHGNDSTTSTNNWKVPPSTPGDSSTKKAPIERSKFDDDSSSDDDYYDNLTSPADKWKAPPSNLGDSSTKKTPIDSNVRSPFDDDNASSTTPADNWKVPPSSLGDSSKKKKAPTDWKVRSPFDDNNAKSTTPADNWKVPPSTSDSIKKTPTDSKDRSPFDDDNDSSTTPADNWKVPPSTFGSTKKAPTDSKDRSVFEDDDDDSTPPANNWKVLSSTLDSTKKTPTNWKDRSLFDSNSKKATPASTWKLPPLIDDDGSSRTNSADNPEGPPPNRDEFVDNNSITAIPTYTPYLQLPHLLSLAWVTYPVISLIIVAFRLQLSLASAENGLNSVKNDLLASCSAAEQAATAAASLPRYMAQSSNRQFADAANGVMTAAQDALILSLTVVEALINFVIDIFRSTFLCLLELALGIGLSLVTDAVQAVRNLSLFLSHTNASLAQHHYLSHRK